MMTIKQAREFAKMTQQDVEDEFGVPRRSLQNWESGVRECPSYVEEWLVEKLTQEVRFAQIRWEEAYKPFIQSEPKKGFSCWLNDPDDEEMTFTWFFPCDDKNRLSSNIVWEIGKLIENGWKVRFIG